MTVRRKAYSNRDVGRGDLTPPPYNETGFVYRQISENRKISGSPAGRCGHRPQQRHASLYRNQRNSPPFSSTGGGVRSPRPTLYRRFPSTYRLRLFRRLHRADRVVRPYNEGTVFYRVGGAEPRPHQRFTVIPPFPKRHKKTALRRSSCCRVKGAPGRRGEGRVGGTLWKQIIRWSGAKCHPSPL